MREDDLTTSLPPWFRRWGIGAWLVVGMALVIIAGTWLLAKTSSIANPLIAGAVIAAVSGVIVERLEARRWPRVAGAAVVTFGLAVLTVVVAGLVLGGISSQAPHINSLLSHASDRIQGWAIIMAVIIFLANGPLQQVIQPVVYGATLKLNPLVVFSVTIGPARCSAWPV